jgi:hypothetical protein
MLDTVAPPRLIHSSRIGAVTNGVRCVVEVIFLFANCTTDVVEKQFLRVDVTEEFPFLVTKLSPYYDRWPPRIC